MKVAARHRPPVPLRRWLIRQRWQSWLYALAVAGAVAALLMWRGAQHTEPWRSLVYGTWQVTAVDDSGALTVRRATQSHAVCLLGIEPIDSGAYRRTIQSLIGEGAVRVSFDAQSIKAPDNRLAGYVYLPDGRMLNEALLLGGAARPSTTVPHELTRWFKRLSSRAK